MKPLNYTHFKAFIIAKLSFSLYAWVCVCVHIYWKDCYCCRRRRCCCLLSCHSLCWAADWIKKEHGCWFDVSFFLIPFYSIRCISIFGKFIGILKLEKYIVRPSVEIDKWNESRIKNFWWIERKYEDRYTLIYAFTHSLVRWLVRWLVHVCAFSSYISAARTNRIEYFLFLMRSILLILNIIDFVVVIVFILNVDGDSRKANGPALIACESDGSKWNGHLLFFMVVVFNTPVSNTNEIGK